MVYKFFDVLQVVLLKMKLNKMNNYLKKTIIKRVQFGSGFESSCSHLNFRFAPASSNEFLDIQATIECRFTLKRVRDMTRTYSLIN